MYKGKKVLAVIPARGGSKRLPKKNVLDLAGKPLIAWTIEAALESKYIDNVIVSTDSMEIKAISEKYGANVPFIRPTELASDVADSISVVKHALEYYMGIYDYVILLQPTSPLRTSQDIDSAFVLLESRAKAVVSVCETEHSPLWSNILPEDRNMKDFIRNDIKNKRSQDLPKYYRLNGAIYISDISYLNKENGFIGPSTKAYIMLQESSIDIDNTLDFMLSKFLIKQNKY